MAFVDWLIQIPWPFGAAGNGAASPGALAWLLDPKNALGAAALSLGTVFITWTGRQIYNGFVEARRRRRMRRELALKVAIDVRTRLENLDSQAFDAAAEAALIEAVRQNDKPKRPFRGYVTASADKNSYDAFDAVLHEFDPHVIIAFQRFVQSDALLDKQYAGLGSDTFAALSTERKVRAVELMFESVREASQAAKRLLFNLALADGLEKLASIIDPPDKESDRRQLFQLVDRALARRGSKEARQALARLCFLLAEPSDDGRNGADHHGNSGSTSMPPR